MLRGISACNIQERTVRIFVRATLTHYLYPQIFLTCMRVICIAEALRRDHAKTLGGRRGWRCEAAREPGPALYKIEQTT